MRVSSFLAMAVLTGFVLYGCGSDTLTKDTMLETLSEIKLKGEIVWADGTAEGFDCYLPKGTIMKVLVTQRTGVTFVECVPQKVNGNDDPGYIRSVLLPPSHQMREDMTTFSLTVDANGLGTAFRKIE